MQKTYELVIIGGGPAGCAAAVYAARKQIKSAIIAYEFGGQSSVSDDIQNWIGTPHISGIDLSKNLEQHVKEYSAEFVDIFKGKNVTQVTKNKDSNSFQIELDDGQKIESLAVLITSGSGRRKLEAVNADKFEHKGLTYCASCDGPLFSGMDVAVIGGGNAGFESALQLSAYCKNVYLLNRSENFKVDEVTLHTVEKNPKIKIILNAVCTEVLGQDFVNGLVYKDVKSNTEHKLDLSGIFIEIGQTPNTQIAEGLVELDQYKKIIVDHYRMRTKTDGVWAAGDCTDGLYHQNNIAAGDAVKALEDIYQWLQARKHAI